MLNHIQNKIKILAIESSCDETSASLCEAKFKIKILSNIISSQVKLHAKYRGVYPELASREHVKNILPVIQASLEENSIKNLVSSIKKHDSQILNTKYQIPDANFDYIAVTSGPGLIGSLLVGVETAKTLSHIFNKPIIPVNHLEGHIYANFLGENLKLPKFPILALIVSGGHTSLVYMKNHLDYKVIGETLDDAAGEAFDKVSAMLGLGYPGGPVISALAEKTVIANETKRSINTKIAASSRHGVTPRNDIHFPRPMIDSGNFDFSFSGLKTSVLYTIKKLPKPLTRSLKIAICKEFQNAVIETLIAKTLNAAKRHRVRSILLCGGVASNSRLRNEFKLKIKNFPPAGESGKFKIDFFVPEKVLCTDNAAMIAAAAAYKIALGKKPATWYNVNADSNLQLDK